ncbi:hypothetical protein JTE90_024174 [Oedothorax gibbosus]|uniref:Uncharacterized protein n=1 Tax=Oedothorax gibbosus TaxID=931172 RepID=A0AAV6UDV9_9ARAC|nr:hypothetical protein JTE90_024174 [Oedothorax gibbosus]
MNIMRWSGCLSALDRMPNDDYKVVIRADKRPSGRHERTFNAPTIDEVAILIVGENLETRDIVLTPNVRNKQPKFLSRHRITRRRKTTFVIISNFHGQNFFLKSETFIKRQDG